LAERKSGRAAHYVPRKVVSCSVNRPVGRTPPVVYLYNLALLYVFLNCVVQQTYIEVCRENMLTSMGKNPVN